MLIVQIGSYPLSPDRIRGGVEASVYGLAQEQSNENEVHVFDTPRIGGDSAVETDGRVIVHRYCNKRSRQIQTIRLVKRMAAEICALNPDVCHIHGTSLFSWWMYRRLIRNKQKVVVTVHGLAYVEKRNMLKKRISIKRILQFFYQGNVEKRFLSHLPFAIVDTEYVKEKVNNYPIRRKPRMHVIPQGINECFFSINCSAHSNNVLSVGAIGERKGHLLTLRAFERVREMGLEAKLIIVGSVADKSYLQSLQKAIEESVYSKDIVLNVDLSDKDLKQMYQMAHLFALHTEEESQGIVFAEAMATGMPIVSTNVGGVPFVVQDGIWGLLSNYGDVESYVSHLAVLMKDKSIWQSFSSSAKQVSNRYHWSDICERIIALYKAV
jgi:glycosyltransferase involved in cell wall biosynthesis